MPSPLDSSFDEPGRVSSDVVPFGYLVLREGGRWCDIYRLIPNVSLFVGRDPANHIIIPSEKCSRKHCEFKGDGQHWTVRDLGSSNGTLVNGVRLIGEQPLQEGDIVRIAAREILFTLDPSGPLTSIGGEMDRPTPFEVAQAQDLDDSFEEDSSETPAILKQKTRSRYREESAASDSVRQGFSALYRLVSSLVEARDFRALADQALKGIVDVLAPDICGILFFEEPTSGEAQVDDLRLMAWKAPDNKPYHRVSDHLSKKALTSGDGTLALDMSHDVAAQGLQTLETMNAQSVICAPIRSGSLIYGLVHLYSLAKDRQFDDEALDFTLAVCEHMAGLLARLHGHARLSEELRREQDRSRGLAELLAIESDLIGQSHPIRQLKDEIARFAVSDSTALIRGESGVGKELVARAMHFNSPRRTGPYVCINCAALTESLLESELFGHEKGAFTGATDRKIGKFEQADLGTLFLDEVGEMSLSFQTRFLRVLEGHAFERVGGHTPIKVNVRVVSATNRDLEQAVREGTFRKDLFFRLNILDLFVPPLRDRRDDIELLAGHFLQQCARRQGREARRFSREVLDQMRRYDWPGNVRELRNSVERAYALARTDIITVADMRFSNVHGGPVSDTSEELYDPVRIDEVERRHIEATLRYTKWVKREAARILGIERSTLDRKLKSYGIDRPEADA